MIAIRNAAAVFSLAALAALAQEAKITLIRSISGTLGERREGRITIQNPRSRFVLRGTEQAVVFFEWEGPAGVHAVGGRWINPHGGEQPVSQVTVENTRGRFGVNWPVTLNPDTIPGVWTLYAVVDGQPAGSHQMEVVPGPRAVSSEAVVRIEKLDAAGEAFDTASGFLVASGSIVTAFQSIDGALGLRIRYASGKAERLDDVVLWNRIQDWAILQSGMLTSAALPLSTDLASAGPPNHRLLAPLEKPAPRGGDDFATWFASTRDEPIPDSVQFTLLRSQPVFGDRLELKAPLPDRAAGAPILNESGQVIAIAGGSVTPGLRSYAPRASLMRAADSRSGKIAAATPVSALPPPDQWRVVPTLLRELFENGQFLPPMAEDDALNSGMFTKTVEFSKKKPPTSSAEQFEFKASDGTIYLLVAWSPGHKRHAISSASVYDMQNKQVAGIVDEPIEIRPNSSGYQAVEVKVATLATGDYRVDYRLDGVPVWRGFFTIHD